VFSSGKEFTILNQSNFSDKQNVLSGGNVLVDCDTVPPGKKLAVSDFVKNFRNRFSEMRQILETRSELQNLISINKISGNRQGISIIGMVLDKKITKNKNILLDVEDLTGRMKVLINQNKSELSQKANEITLDSVIGFKGSGNREILFVNDVFFYY